MDGEGLKLEKMGQRFQGWMLHIPKLNPKILVWIAFPDRVL